MKKPAIILCMFLSLLMISCEEPDNAPVGDAEELEVRDVAVSVDVDVTRSKQIEISPDGRDDDSICIFSMLMSFI